MAMIETAGHKAPLEIIPGAILCSIPQACAMIGRGTQAIYDLIGRGQIEAVKSDGRTLVRVESLHRYAAALPPAKIKPLAKRPPHRMRRRA
jgi:Helix-turn-helix domain